MKDLTKEDIKVGSIWIDNEPPIWKVEVTYNRDGRIYYKVIDSPDFDTDFPKNHSYAIRDFLHHFRPVYTVEGFEV